MAKFEKFDPRENIRGLAETARRIQVEELIREGKMPSFDQVVVVIDETRRKYLPQLSRRGRGSKSEEYDLMPMICCIQEFVEEITKAVAKLSPEEKRKFREAWISYVDKRQADRRFLKSCGINPNGY